MSVFYYEPYYDFDRLLDGIFTPRTARNGVHKRALQSDATPEGAVRALKPRMDLHEDKEKNLVTATFEFPGSKKEDVHLEIHNGRLVVSVENKISEEHDESGYAVRERRYGKFSRTLQLPQGVKDDEIKAGMEDGVLTVTFPKSGAELAPKKISIS
uniref:Small heat shock protein n=1 Tax=Laccaria bicolor TaxID=29883 RepID=Q8NJ78_LACBI|nr:small heat shock protein [Laccaria bicolor]